MTKDIELYFTQKSIYESLVSYQKRLTRINIVIHNITQTGELWRRFVIQPTSHIIWHVSNFGRILKNESIRNGTEHNDGYLYLGNMVAIHQIVATGFIPKSIDDIKSGRNVIDHIDGDRSNNCVSNLRWCTIAENNRFPLYRKRNADSKLGILNPAYGKEPHSKNKVLYNNGCEAHYYEKGCQPTGFIKGRIK